MIFDSLPPGLTFENNPIETFRSEVKGAKFIYLVAGVHGDEVEAIYVFKKLFDWLCDDHSMQDIPSIVVPILNKDGYFRQTRENARNQDLNANFPTDVPSEFTKSEKFLSEPETNYLSQLFKKYRPGLVLNFMSHTAPALTFEGDAQIVASFISKLNSYPMKSEKIFDRGTLCHYAWHYFHSPVVNILLPKMSDDLNLDEIWQHNQMSFKKLFLSDVLRRYL